MSAIVELAKRLGKTIAESEQANNLRAIQKELETESDITKALSDYQAQSEKLMQLQNENKPIEVDDKHKLQELQNVLVASEVFKKFTAAQVEYVDLMRQVNEAIRQELGDIESA